MGFRPISIRYVMQYVHDPKYNLNDMEEEAAIKEAQLLAVNDFLQHELALPNHEIDTMPIKRIFFPRDKDSRTLYVEFSDDEVCTRIFRRAKNIPENTDNPRLTASIEKYIPPNCMNVTLL